MTIASETGNRLLIPRPDARRILGGIGETKLWELEKANELEVVRIGRRSFVTTESLYAYVERLRGANDPSAEAEASQDEITTDGGDE